MVTAFGSAHPWQGDIDLCAAQGCNYLRLWAFLAQDTQEWPWLRLSNGKWDLTQWNPVFWQTVQAVMREADSKGIVIEPMIFDRGCGGNQADYRAYPWHPSNNVNGTGSQLPQGGLGTPEFYEAPKGSNLHNLQAAYVAKWVEELRPFRNVILEIENEHRAGGGIAWAKQWANLIKSLDSSRLVSYSSLEEDLEAAYGVPNIDVVNKHFGDEGDNPQVLSRYVAEHWRHGKVVNVDEFANGQSDPTLMQQQCEAITKAGGSFHIEDATSQAKPEVAAKKMRDLLATLDPPPCWNGVPVPPPVCEPEVKRGAAFYRADWAGGSCVGDAACDKVNKTGFPVGTLVAFDSTIMTCPNAGCPLPPGCPVTRTNWSINPTNPMRTRPDELFAMQSKFTKAGTYNVCAKGVAAQVCIPVKIK